MMYAVGARLGTSDKRRRSRVTPASYGALLEAPVSTNIGKPIRMSLAAAL